jgi:uncharacterized protein (DUF427 family)
MAELLPTRDLGRNGRVPVVVVTGMTDKLVLIPGADHPITITPADATVTVHLGQRLIAKTDHGLVLREAGYRPVYYLPLDDVDADVLEPTTHETYCPYKGDASYYSLRDGDTLAENAVWTYVAPYDAVSAIAGHVAFYPDRVTISAA